jgi:hypothetical protein
VGGWARLSKDAKNQGTVKRHLYCDIESEGAIGRRSGSLTRNGCARGNFALPATNEGYSILVAPGKQKQPDKAQDLIFALQEAFPGIIKRRTGV